MRLPMPVGPWNEPLGTDCYWNQTGFTVFAIVVIALDVPVGLLALSEAVQNRNRVLRTAFAGMFLAALSNIALIGTAFYSHAYGFLVWSIFTFCLVFWGSVTEAFTISTTMQTVSKVSNQSLVTILGGPGAVLFLLLVYIMSISLVMVGCIGAAVFSWSDTLATRNFWIAHSVGWVVFTTTFVVHGSISFARFAFVIDESLSSTAAITSLTEAKRAEMHEMAKRFKKVSVNVFLTLPMACGFWFLHAFVLPMWWWIVLLHSLNNVMGSFALYWVYSPVSRRAKIMPCLIDPKYLTAVKTSSTAPVVNNTASSPQNKSAGTAPSDDKNIVVTVAEP